MFNRQNNYEHWVICPCGWRGFSADMEHTYMKCGSPDNCDVEPLDLCPNCGEYEYDCKIYLISMRRELIEECV